MFSYRVLAVAAMIAVWPTPTPALQAGCPLMSPTYKVAYGEEGFLRIYGDIADFSRKFGACTPMKFAGTTNGTMIWVSLKGDLVVHQTGETFTTTAVGATNSKE